MKDIKNHPLAAVFGLCGQILFATIAASASTASGAVIILLFFTPFMILYLWSENAKAQPLFILIPATILALVFILPSGFKGEGMLISAGVLITESVFIRLHYKE